MLRTVVLTPEDEIARMRERLDVVADVLPSVGRILTRPHIMRFEGLVGFVLVIQEQEECRELFLCCSYPSPTVMEVGEDIPYAEAAGRVVEAVEMDSVIVFREEGALDTETNRILRSEEAIGMLIEDQECLRFSGATLERLQHGDRLPSYIRESIEELLAEEDDIDAWPWPKSPERTKNANV